MTDKSLPSPELLRKLLRYDPETGNFIWLRRDAALCAPGRMANSEQMANRWNGMHAGKPAFRQKNRKGYLTGKVAGRFFSAHRVAYAMHHGRWPVDQIDHINGVRDDNRIVNLREVDITENSRNTKRSSANTSGRVGVGWHKLIGKWAAYISVQRKMQHLGYYDTRDEAIAVREAAEKRLGFHANHGRGST